MLGQKSLRFSEGPRAGIAQCVAKAMVSSSTCHDGSSTESNSKPSKEKAMDFES
jgi:hypothetical protein